MPACGLADAAARAAACRNSAAASHLKLISIFVIFITSVVGISSPVMLARSFQGKPAYDKALLVIKCFAAGVILSTSLVHVMPDAFDALADCVVATRHPWKDFPFAGLVTLIGALLALLVDLTVDLGWVLQVAVVVELEADEAHQGFVKLQEGEHDGVVDVIR